jgi:hypothetical protein
MSLENITTCQNNLIANNYLHVDMKEVVWWNFLVSPVRSVGMKLEK